MALKSKRLLKVNKYYPPHVGGIETMVERYADFLSQRFEVTVLVCNDTAGRPLEKKVIRESLVVYRASVWKYIKKTPISFQFIRLFILKLQKIDIVHIHEPFPLGTIAALALYLFPRKRLIVSWHSDIVRQNILRTLLAPVYYLTLRRANVIITTSDALRETSKTLRAHLRKVKVVPLSISAEAPFDRDIDFERRFYTAFKNNKGFNLFFGRLAYYKGIETIISCYKKYGAELPPVLICGLGELKDVVQKAADELPERVFFFEEFISEGAKQFLLNNATAFLFPSTHASEAFGIVQLEAMRQGVPVINTQLPTGVPWVSVDRISGLTIDVGDEDQLAHAILRINSDDVLRDRLSIGAKNRFRNLFSDQVIQKKLVHIYSEVSD